MRKYFSTQLKRLCRLLPIVLAVILLLSCSVYLIYKGMIGRWNKSETFKKFNIGIVGVMEDSGMKSGLDAIKTLDASNMSLEFIEMDEDTAVKKLTSGAITAYVVFPEGFLDHALSGTIIPLRFVSSAGSESIVSLVKDELTSSLANILLSSEFATFGVADVLASYGYDYNVQYDELNELAIEFADIVFERHTVYEVQEVGIAEGFQGVSFGDYLICGLSVVFLFLLTLSFVVVFSKDDLMMSRMLKSGRVGALAQTLCENGAYCLVFWILSSGMLFMIGKFSVQGVLHIFPVTVCVASISYLIYNLCRNLLSGVLVQMILSVAMCFVSGCFYPVYFFPLSVQNMAKYLPASIAREHISCLITGKSAGNSGLILISIGLGCTLLCALLRYVRITSGRGSKH